jgi:hypothetical protein
VVVDGADGHEGFQIWAAGQGKQGHGDMVLFAQGQRIGNPGLQPYWTIGSRMLAQAIQSQAWRYPSSRKVKVEPSASETVIELMSTDRICHWPNRPPGSI